MITGMPSKRATSKGRLRKDWSLAAQKHYQRINQEWQSELARRQAEEGQMSGGLAAHFVAVPTPPPAPPNPQEERS